MTSYLELAFKSLWHRRETVTLTVLSVALSVFLLLGVERLREAAEGSFTQSISRTDLIVGARTGPTNLVLSVLFNRGYFTNTLSWDSYNHWKNQPSVDWTIPISLGDGHRGYRVVGTTTDFFKHYRYQGDYQLKLQRGAWFQDTDLNDLEKTDGHSEHEHEGAKGVVIGSKLAQVYAYDLGSEIVLEHGVTHDVGFLKHSDSPFSVVGILEPTGTLLDQSLFISLEDLNHIHGEQVSHSHSHKEAPLTAFLMGLKNRVDILRLQREINTFEGEPLTAVIPSVVMNDLWNMVGQVGQALKLLGFCILVVSLISMVTLFLASFNERRREMAILRALGVGPQVLAGLLLLESGLMILSAIVVGIVGLWFVKWGFASWIQTRYGLFLASDVLQLSDFGILMEVFILGLLMALYPAFRAYRGTLKEGLLVR